MIPGPYEAFVLGYRNGDTRFEKLAGFFRKADTVTPGGARAIHAGLLMHDDIHPYLESVFVIEEDTEDKLVLRGVFQHKEPYTWTLTPLTEEAWVRLGYPALPPEVSTPAFLQVEAREALDPSDSIGPNTPWEPTIAPAALRNPDLYTG